MDIDKEIDLKGEVCPYTFVKSKLALENMKTGEVLRVKIDYPEAVENVPDSMENQGQKVLNVEKISDGEWELIIKKEEEF